MVKWIRDIEFLAVVVSYVHGRMEAREEKEEREKRNEKYFFLARLFDVVLREISSFSVVCEIEIGIK